jgi:cytochrome c peroxidase
MYKILFFISLTTSILFSSQAISPIPESVNVNKEKAALGKKLFFDTRLSKDNTINCANCHILESGGDDNLRFSFGIKG